MVTTQRRPASLLITSLVLAGTLAGCTSTVIEGSVNPTLDPAQQTALDELLGKIDDVKGLTHEAFLQRHALPFVTLGYDPGTAQNLPLIQASALALDAKELGVLSQQGLVISERQRFPSFVYGYEALYAHDLPLFISADSILHAVHRSYDEVLKLVETASLAPELTALLGSMRTALPGVDLGGLGDRARPDADLYLAVALALLQGAPAAPVAGADVSEVSALVAAAEAASGMRTVDLFGVPRMMDFSQFTPRGHYTDSPELTRYFKAMMWLGRIDLRLIETQPDHTQVFHRRQLEGALALNAVMDGAAMERWTRINRAIEAFVGESDNMMPTQVSALLRDLGVTGLRALQGLSDQRIAQVIMQGGYGTQRIASHIMINGLGKGTMPLSSTFLLFGQRYVVDSHVFSNVVYDRVQGGRVNRMMPDPLDVAFAALGNDQAGLRLAGELERFGYAPDLEAMRLLVDAHDDKFWNANLYNLWLTALRALSPAPALAAPQGLPPTARTEPWGRRILNTQLASWAELRHDTILYAKQSYTTGNSCEFPDAYVDPYPEFYAALERFASHGLGLSEQLRASSPPWLADGIRTYFGNLGKVAATLRGMAEHQRTGTPFTPEQMAFVNRAIHLLQGCGSPSGFDGWYADLHFSMQGAFELDPTIADVHTQPTDEVGNPVGRVLHVGTGMPRLMVVTIETCSGPRAYAGLASSYFEQITEKFDRLDDPRWAFSLKGATPPDVRWMSDLVVR